MNHVIFQANDGRTFRVSMVLGNMNASIEQRFMSHAGVEQWIVVHGPNNQLRNLAIDALAEAFL
jgi:hypothetical protein